MREDTRERVDADSADNKWACFGGAQEEGRVQHGLVCVVARFGAPGQRKGRVRAPERRTTSWRDAGEHMGRRVINYCPLVACVPSGLASGVPFGELRWRTLVSLLVRPLLNEKSTGVGTVVDGGAHRGSVM